MKAKDYRLTSIACKIGAICQGICCNFAPLLFVYFNESFGISFYLLSLLSFITFFVQLLIDYFSVFFVDRIGYKITGIISEALIIIGLALFSFLPSIMEPFIGILIPLSLFSIGAGLMEVVASPIMESISKHNAANLVFLHSFYSISAAITIIITSVFFILFNIDYWWVLSIIFALIALVGIIFFLFAPIPKTIKANEEQEDNILTIKPFYKNSTFYLILILMIFSGSTEIAIAQWASSYAEVGLNVVKPFGDLYGAAIFAIMMAISRILCATILKKLKVEINLLLGSIFCLVGYLLASLVNIPIINFIGTMLVGFGVGPLWPGTLSLAAKKINNVEQKMYSYTALAGDIGCCLGTYIIGALISPLGFKYAILLGAVSPILFIVFLIIVCKKKTSNE